uniref:Uncharacterized protein n=1 Tax=Aegilops tauschii subsp. strangulata TaxID=200361 RepID=A0A452YUA8_AEGTS
GTEVLPETVAKAGKQGAALTDAWDYKGRPAARATTGGWGCAAMILGAELFERMTTLGIAVNLVPYMTGTMHLGSAASANTVTNFIGTSFMLCLLGGFIADSYLGRYLTIAVFSAVQATGVMILTISTVAPGLRPAACGDATGQSPDCVPANGTQLGVLYLGLYMTALGTGGLKSSVSGFGSDQFDESDDGERKMMMRFFNWFYFFVSIGALLAVTVLVYVQDNVGRRWGYGVVAVGILCGLGVFLSGTRKYRFKKLVGSPLTQVATVTAAAWRKRSLPLPSDPSMLYDVDNKAAAGEDLKGKLKLPHSKECRRSQLTTHIPRPRSRRRPGVARGGERLDAVHADGRGGGEAGGADAAHLGHHHHVLDHPRADDHLRRRAGVRHEPCHRRLGVPHPGGLPHRLPHRLHPPHRAPLRPPRGPRGPPRHRQPARPLPAPARLRRPLPVHRRDGRRRAHRAVPPHRVRRRRHAHRVPAHAPVPARRGRRGVHVHGAARFLPARVPQGDEDHEHGAVPQHLRAWIFLQHAHSHHRAQGHWTREQRRLARQQHRPREARLLLLVARRHERNQYRLLHDRRKGLRVQGETHGRCWHRAR